jgi:tryptophan synthase alpha subunit
MQRHTRHATRNRENVPEKEERKVSVFGMLLQDLVHELLVIVDVVAEAFNMSTIPLASPKACAQWPPMRERRPTGSAPKPRDPTAPW